MNRSVRVQVSCIHCGTSFSERFADVRSGVRKSCGCKRSEAFLRYCTNLAIQFPEWKRKLIFDCAELHGKEATAVRFKISEVLAKAVWVHGRLLIKQSRSASLLNAMAAKLNSNFAVMRQKMGLSAGYALAICRIARRNASESATPVSSEPSQTLPQAHSIADLLQDSISTAVAVVINPCLMNCRRIGELNTSELSRTKRSRYGWAYKWLLEMSAVERAAYKKVDEFLSICEYSFERRAIRWRHHVSRWVSNKGVLSYAT